MINRLYKIILRSLGKRLLPVVKIPYAQYSVIVPAECWKSTPNERLVRVSLAAIESALRVDHSDIASRMLERPFWPTIWPGEHYKLLTALTEVLHPKLVIEIGTATGYSALAIKKKLLPGARLVSFDVVSWKDFPKCVLRQEDFESGQLEQVLADLSDVVVFEKYRALLEAADFVFIDAAKDGLMEQRFIDNFRTIQFQGEPIFVFDDIRLMNMIDIWQSIDKPKLDLTSFGHWAGTGLVDWSVD